jgi:hypothetical protein
MNDTYEILIIPGDRNGHKVYAYEVYLEGVQVFERHGWYFHPETAKKYAIDTIDRMIAKEKLKPKPMMYFYTPAI